MKKRVLAVLLGVFMLFSNHTAAFAGESTAYVQNEKAMSIMSENDTDLLLNGTAIGISVGQSVRLRLSDEFLAQQTARYINPQISNIQWGNLENAAIASLQGDVLTGISYGQTTLTATIQFTYDGYNYNYNYDYDYDDEWYDDELEYSQFSTYGMNTGTVTVYFDVYVSDPQLDNTEYFVNCYGGYEYDGYYECNKYIVLKGIHEGSAVSWETSSSNLKLVESYDGEYQIYAKKAGVYTVVFTVDGVALKECKVTVLKAYFERNKKSTGDEGYKTKKWHEMETMLLLSKGEKTSLKLKGIPSGVKVKWASSDKAVATVNSSGNVTAKGYGYAVIQAQAGDMILSYKVGVSYPAAVSAIRYADKHYNSVYSQEKRMSKGYYDCSSYVYRAYKDAGVTLGNNGNWAPTAADLAKWCKDNNYMLFEGAADTNSMLPGDLIFETGASNGRYKGIYHVDLYVGNGISITVARNKYYGDCLWDNAMVARPLKGSTTTKGVKASGVKKNGIKLTWGNNYGAYCYRVYRSTSKYGKYEKIASVKGKRQYEDTSAKAGTYYYYKVQPCWRTDSHTYAGKCSDIVGCKAK